MLEIHHIDTGRGNATLVIGPDATTILIDAGEAHSPERLMSPARPNASRTAGEWIARYVARQLTRIDQTSLHTLLLTHLHGDHVGEITASAPQSSQGDYKLTGASWLAEKLNIKQIIDRGWPNYIYPAPQTDPSALNYIAFARSQVHRGTTLECARAGSAAQITLHNQPQKYTDFQARVLAANGDLWTGNGDNTAAQFPPVAGMSTAERPSENMCCIALRIQYGNFRYYTGGDLPCDTTYGRYPWHDIETPVAERCGPVSVAVANHHGYFDACGPAAVRALRPSVWIVPTWHASHPDMAVLANLFSEDLYPGRRLVFATGMTPEAIATTDRFSSRLSSTRGHVVLRVPPGGSEFMVRVVDSGDEQSRVLASFGPIPAEERNDPAPLLG